MLVREAKRLNIPVFAMVDTCCDPTDIDYVIPANDDAAKSIELILTLMCNAIAEGLEERKLEKEKDDEQAADDEARTERREGKPRIRKSVKVAQAGQQEFDAEPAQAPQAEEEQPAKEVAEE